MKRLLGLFAIVTIVISLGVLSACSDNNVTMTFKLTDAPIDPSTVTKVNVTVTSVAINESKDRNVKDDDGSWKVMTLSPAVTVDLLRLQNGVFDELGNGIALKGGTQVNQIRLGVEKVEIEESGTLKNAEIPSKTGLKIVKAFQVPLSGEVSVTIDFDARKSIVKNASGYTVKPVLRAIVSNEAGTITGTVPGAETVVYAYADGTYVPAEASTPNADGLTFTNAYTSAAVKADKNFTLAFMDAGTYDLYAVTGGTVTALKADVIVEANKTTAGQALAAGTP